MIFVQKACSGDQEPRLSQLVKTTFVYSKLLVEKQLFLVPVKINFCFSLRLWSRC